MGPRSLLPGGRRRWRCRAFRLLVVAAVALAGVLAVDGEAVAVRVPATLADGRPVATGPVEPGFAIGYLGVVWAVSRVDAPAGLPGDGQAAVRFRRDGEWGPWQRLPEDELAVPGQWASSLVPGGGAEAYQVRGVPRGAIAPRVVALNTTDGAPVTVGYRRSGAAAVANCLSRAEWGADESLRFVGGIESWPVEFTPARVMTVHHTATANNDLNPAATVRAIYWYHTVPEGRGWGDIGYQYLIDESGRVYEGRWSGAASVSCGEGGDGSDFGHDEATGGVVTAGHTYCYNRGNLGVALLGDFTAVQPKPAARVALEALLAENATRHGLDPLGTVWYEAPNDVTACAAAVDTNIAVISGHTDWPGPGGDTACPGAAFHAHLGAVRANVAGVPPAGFGKSAPADGAQEQSPGPALTWGASAGADSYEYCYDTSDDGACEGSWTDAGLATGAGPLDLDYATTYYWQVRAYNASGTVYADGSEGAFWEFTTMGPPPAAFGKSAPADGAGGLPRAPTLSWGASAGADSYEYCYDASDDGACEGSWTDAGPATGVGLTGLDYATTYYWQARARNPSGVTYADGSEAAEWVFTTAGPLLLEATFRSVGTRDGSILERDEASGRGGVVDVAAPYLWLGDDDQDRQYRSILDFDTAALPDEAVVVGAMLRVKRADLTGLNAFGTHGLLLVDVETGFYHDDPALERFDFHAVGSRGNVGRFIKTPDERWYRAPLRAPSFPLVNLTGVTQFRLRFDLEDDDDSSADFVLFFSGNAPAEADRPELVVTYYLP